VAAVMVSKLHVLADFSNLQWLNKHPGQSIQAFAYQMQRVDSQKQCPLFSCCNTFQI